MMQLPVLLGPPSICHGRVIRRQELLVKPTRQDAKNLHWVIRIVVIDRLRPGTVGDTPTAPPTAARMTASRATLSLLPPSRAAVRHTAATGITHKITSSLGSPFGSLLSS